MRQAPEPIRILTGMDDGLRQHPNWRVFSAVQAAANMLEHAITIPDWTAQHFENPSVAQKIKQLIDVTRCAFSAVKAQDSCTYKKMQGIKSYDWFNYDQSFVIGGKRLLTPTEELMVFGQDSMIDIASAEMKQMINIITHYHASQWQIADAARESVKQLCLISPMAWLAEQDVHTLRIDRYPNPESGKNTLPLDMPQGFVHKILTHILGRQSR